MTLEKKRLLMPPAIGYSFRILIDLIRKNKVHFRYYPRILAILIVNLVHFPFRAYERAIINPRIKKKSIIKDPVFILGHWRSGTTHPIICYVKTLRWDILLLTKVCFLTRYLINSDDFYFRSFQAF